jgi:uncharacterized membrane protein
MMFKRWFLAGLVVIVPIAVTVFVLNWLFLLLDGFFGPLINRLLSRYLDFRIPGIGLVFLVLLIMLVGAFASFVTGKFFRQIEAFFLRLPFVDKIYIPVKKIVAFLFVEQKPAFKKVVLVEYPRKGIYSLGFVTNDDSIHVSDAAGRKVINVFIASSPSPLTGFLTFVPEDELIPLFITVEDAVRLIVSGGMLTPEHPGPDPQLVSGSHG